MPWLKSTIFFRSFHNLCRLNITRDFLIIITCGSQCLFYIILCCLTFLFYTLQHSTAFCAVPGHVRSTAACNVPGSIRDRFTEAPAALHLSVLQQSLLPLDPECVCSIAACAVPGGDWPTSRLCCTWTYLSTRACAVLHLDVSVYESLYCAAPGRICLREPVLCWTWTCLSDSPQ